MQKLTVTRFIRISLFSLGLAVGSVQPSHAFDFGTWPVKRGWQQVTHASWYGREFAGRRTAMGRRFNPNELTAAHRSLELGTWVRVTDLTSGRSVVVQITDRGPFRRPRGIDLSYEAARQLGMVGRGVTRVLIELAAAPGTDDRDAAISSGNRVARAETGKNGRSGRDGAVTVAAFSTDAWLPKPSVQWGARSARYSYSGQRSEIQS